MLRYESGIGPGRGPYKWGFQVGSEDNERGTKYEWFKLALQPREQESELEKTYPFRYPKVSDFECKELVVDYLKALNQNLEHELRKHYGQGFSRDQPMEYIITVPAIWTDKAKETTRECSIRAGMITPGNKLRMIKEPEAAGIFALQHMNDFNLDVDDTFVLCDAGGG